MKRLLIIAAVAIVTLTAAGWLASPRIVTVLTDRVAARNREKNRLPDDALHALITDPKLILFSIDPDHGTASSPEVPTFQRWPVLGQTTIATSGQRQQLADTLQDGLGRWSGREVVSCFSPRHAIRANNDAQTFDFLICFECGRLYYYHPNSDRRHLNIRTKAGPFDDILAAANVPMPKQQ